MNDCLDGSLYDHFAPFGWDRDTVKQQFLKVIYGWSGQHKHHALAEAVAELYPEMYAHVLAIKLGAEERFTRLKLGGPSWKKLSAEERRKKCRAAVCKENPGGKLLSHQMQKMESDLMINRVAARFIRENTSVPVLTIHDSLLVPPGYQHTAALIIQDEWQAAYQVTPKLKESKFTDPQEPRKKRKQGNNKKQARVVRPDTSDDVGGDDPSAELAA